MEAPAQAQLSATPEAASARTMQDFARDGFFVTPRLVDEHACAAIEAELDRLTFDTAGTRCMLHLPWCAALAHALRAHPALATLLAPDTVPVQCTLFEKSTGRNWLVPPHQDVSIPVAGRVGHSPQLAGWSVKEGITHVQPPAGLLAQMMAVRLHIDPCGEADGALRVLPGSHREGRLSPARIAELRASRTELLCAADRGSAMLMRPLLLHASSRASGDSRRRVLHFLFGPANLPFGLRWPDIA